MEDADELKKKKLQELKSQMEEKELEEEKRKEMEKQKKQLLRKILTSEARSRLTNLKIARAQFAEKVELQLIQIARSGRVELPINDDQLKKILKKLQKNKKSINIKRK